MVEFARTGLDIGVTSGTRRYCPMGGLDILGNAYPFAEVAVRGGKALIEAGSDYRIPHRPSRWFPIWNRNRACHYHTEGGLFHTRPAIALLLCGRICSYKKNMFARTRYVGVSASNAT